MLPQKWIKIATIKFMRSFCYSTHLKQCSVSDALNLTQTQENSCISIER